MAARHKIHFCVRCDLGFFMEKWIQEASWMNHTDLAKDILQLVGGEQNVQSVVHCMTRLRFTLSDNSRADRAGIEKLDGVMGTNISGGQFQIIIGNNVPKVHQALLQNSSLGTDKNIAVESKEKKNPVSAIFEVIAGIFTPIIPAIAGAGMIKGFLALFVTLGWLTAESQTYAILTIVGDGAFYFLPILLAFSAARKFNANPFIAASIGAAILHPNLAALFATGESVSFIGIPVTVVATYASTVIPIILAIWAASYVEKWIDRITHQSLKLIVVPTLTLLIIVPFTLIAVGPLGTIIGDYLSTGVNFLFSNAAIVSSILLGATFSLIIMTGMHYALSPIIINGLAQNGFDYMIPAMFVANMGQAGAALAVSLRTKNKKFKSLSFTTGITALMGITEPAMYGVNMKLKRPFVAAMIGGAAGGFYNGLTGAKAFVITGNAGLPGIPVLIGPTFVHALIGLVIAFAAAMIAGYFLGFQDVEADDTAAPSPENPPEPNKATAQTEHVLSPIQGEVRSLDTVSDATFSQGIMGNGIAIFPTKGEVVSPVHGRITTIFKTKHAIGLTSDQGAEVLIHIGLDTVRLDGQHFTAHMNEGDAVKPGDKIVSFDMEAIQAAGYDLITPIIITNTDQYNKIEPVPQGNVHTGEPLLALSAKASQKILSASSPLLS